MTVEDRDGDGTAEEDAPVVETAAATLMDKKYSMPPVHN